MGEMDKCFLVVLVALSAILSDQRSIDVIGPNYSWKIGMGDYINLRLRGGHQEKLKTKPRQQNLLTSGKKPDLRKLENKLDSYTRKFGLPTPPTVNPLDIIIRREEEKLDERTKFQRRKERFESERGDISKIRKQLREDDAKDPMSKMDEKERKALEYRYRELRQTEGELRRKEKELKLKAQYNREQRERIQRGQRPYLVRDINNKKYSKKFQWERKTPASNAAASSHAAQPGATGPD